MLMKRFILLIYVLSCSALFPVCDYNSNDISIEENFFNDDIIGFYISSIDLESGESTTLLFDYSIDLSGAISNVFCNAQADVLCTDNAIEQTGQTCEQLLVGGGFAALLNEHAIDEVYLHFEISMFVPDFMDENTLLTDGKVRLHQIPSTLSQISFRNTDLNTSTTELTGGVKFDYKQEDVNFHITDDEIEEITDLFMSQGRAPNGVYTFNFKITADENGGNVYDSEIKTVEVFVPSFLDLISPGSADLADSSSNVVMSTNPIFQWNSDYCNKCDYYLRVSEFRSVDHSSLEEALDDYSVLPLGDGFYELPPSINSFQYPNSGVGEIYAGKLYVWQIMRSYDTSNGVNEEFSPLHLFKIQSLDVTDTQDTGDDINLENIKLLIGSDIYDSLFDEEGQLNGYNSVGQMISINNQNVSVSYLIDLINKKNQGQISIIDVNVQ